VNKKALASRKIKTSHDMMKTVSQPHISSIKGGFKQ